MKFLQEAFTIIHIRISSVRILGFKLRNIITVLLTFMLSVNLIQLMYSTKVEIIILDFIESSIFMIVNIYFILIWIKSWPKAGAMLNRAGDYESNIKK